MTPTPACLPEGRICCGVPYFVGRENTHFRQSQFYLPSHGRGGGEGGLGSFFSRCTQKSCCSLSFLRPTNIDGRASEKQKETRQQTASEAAKAESAHYNCCELTYFSRNHLGRASPVPSAGGGPGIPAATPPPPSGTQTCSHMCTPASPKAFCCRWQPHSQSSRVVVPRWGGGVGLRPSSDGRSFLSDLFF